MSDRSRLEGGGMWRHGTEVVGNLKLIDNIEEPRIDNVIILKLIVKQRYNSMNFIYLARDMKPNQTFLNTVINIRVL